MSQALQDLLDLLDLEQIEEDIFRGHSRAAVVPRVFGGQVAAQALVAAGRTVPEDRLAHSLHAYFLRPGDPGAPIVYTSADSVFQILAHEDVIPVEEQYRICRAAYELVVEGIRSAHPALFASRYETAGGSLVAEAADETGLGKAA